MTLGDQRLLDARLASEVFEGYRVACESEAASLWGVSLLGPLLVADPSTGTGFVNFSVADCEPTGFSSVYRSTLSPALAVANTAPEWERKRWTVVCWPLPPDADDRLALLLHEAFHRVQPDLGVTGRSPVVAHLDEARWRTSIRLELRALADALAPPPPAHERAAAMAAAVAIRNQRHSEVADGGRDEDDLESNEGVAEYTGRKLAHAERAQAVRAILHSVTAHTPLVRNFAHFTGPAYGLLLDEFNTGWRPRFVDGATVTELAREVTDFVAVDLAHTARRYGGADIETEERERERQLEAERSAWTQLLVDGPTVNLPVRSLSTVFNPQELVPLAGIGTVYPIGRLSDEWGELVVEHGALVDPEWTTVTVSARDLRTVDRAVTGNQWHLSSPTDGRSAPATTTTSKLRPRSSRPRDAADVLG